MAALPNPEGEQGFVLIAAIWLLILCGAVAAVLLARSLAASTAAAGEAETLRDRLALDAAIETVASDRVINGSRSPFAFVPSEQRLEINGQAIQVRVGAETGKLDLNEGELELVARVLAGMGWDAASRSAFVRRLQAQRASGERLRSMDEVREIAARSRPNDARLCLDDYFTVHGGRPEPDPSFIPPELARLIGRPAGGPVGPRSIGAGVAIRVEAATEVGSRRVAILRTGGLLDQPVIVAAWEAGRICSAP